VPLTRTYNQKWPEGTEQLSVELVCGRHKLPPERGGLGPYRHNKNAINMIWGNVYKQNLWHPWMIERIRSLSNYTVNVWTGAASCGKTWDAGLFAFLFWLQKPDKTSVILTSTTGKMVRRRIWPVIQMLYNDVEGLPGNLVDSKTTLQTRKGDDKSGIYALAVRDGPTSKAVADIQGLHNERMFLVIDEGTDAPEAIMSVIPNLRKGCKDFRILIIGNAASHIDPHGKCCEPKDGWESITVDDESWETKGVTEWEIEPGICLHFDGMKSPNVKAGEDKWPFLLTNKDLTRALALPGAETTVGFWKYTRGFWTPDGVCRTVLSESMITKHKARGHAFIFNTSSRMGAGLDPGFGGDKCVLRTFRLGDIGNDRLGMQLVHTYYIPISASAKEPVHYQIVRICKEICLRDGIDPSCFGLDVTGEGGGLGDIFCREWSDHIIKVEFGGSPSDLPASEEDARPCSDVYDRRVTELAFSIRNFVINEQLKGLSDIEVKQLCAREFDDKKRKISIEPKDICKPKIGGSPDEMDALAVAVEVARRLGVTPGGGGSEHVARRDTLSILRKYDSVNINEPDEDDGLGDVAPAIYEDVFSMSDI
jgi:hypothetical protein